MSISHHFCQSYFLPSQSSSWMTFIQQRRRLIIPKKIVVFLLKMPFFKQETCVLERNTTMFSKVPTVHKRKHLEKRGKKYKMEGPKLWQKEKATNVGRPQVEYEQIKY
jgi:hypothetical protein